VGKVGRVQARLNPPPYAVRYTKGCGICAPNLAEEEGVLPTFRPTPLDYGVLALFQVRRDGFAWVVQWPQR
jgi:hypothetical protein